MSEIVNKIEFDSIKEDSISRYGVSEAEFNKEVGFAAQIINKNYMLKKADPKTAYAAIFNALDVGLTLNPILQHAYLVPRWDSVTKKTECQYMPGYRGLYKLLTDSKQVTSIDTQIVWEGDEIEVDLRSAEKILKHVPYVALGNEQGKKKFVYSVATLWNGDKHGEIMSIADIYKIRERSEAYKAFKAGKIKSTPWDSDEDEMCRKTVLKRHSKYLPKGENQYQIERAIEQDNIANGYYELMTDSTRQEVWALIQTAKFGVEERQKWEQKLADADYERQGQGLLRFVKERQNRIGSPVTQDEIVDEVSKDVLRDNERDNTN
jgi:phage RecT family recombinase